MKRIAIGLGALALGAVACGSSTSTASSVSSGGASAATSSSSTSVSLGFASAGTAYCTDAQTLNTDFRTIFGTAAPPATVQPLVDADLSILAKIQGDAPPEIRSAVSTLAGPTTTYLQTLASRGYDVSRMTSADEAPLMDPASTAAHATTSNYETQFCGIAH